jgi:hypothetical protein
MIMLALYVVWTAAEEAGEREKCKQTECKPQQCKQESR